MKPLTKKNPTALKPAAKPAVKRVLQAPRKAEAQCCAKVSRTVAGCHD